MKLSSALGLCISTLIMVQPAFAQDDPAEWASYGNNPGGMRYVETDKLNASNVKQLKPAWIFHTNVVNDHTSFEAQPIVVDGVLYVTSPHNHVFAIDAATGELKWTYNPEDMPKLSELAICCGQVNRGVAVGDGKVFVGRLDGNLVALDANSGEVAWKVKVADPQEKYTLTAAPQFIDGKVIIGPAGGEFGVRGYVDAYDAQSGERAWRFYTVPGPGEAGHDTWAGESWKTGGATVWTTPMADPELGLVYVTTGNPGPDLNGSERAGDNLYSDSVLALDKDTGTLKWHFQEIHHDLWDYDSAQPVHLFTLNKNGEEIPALGHANKNGYYFVLDRRTGEPIYDVTETEVPTWPDWQNASKTQPVPDTDPLIPQEVEKTPEGLVSAPMWTPPNQKPQLIQPGFEAGPEWSASAYSPRTKYAYIQAGGYEPWLYHADPDHPNSLGSTAVDRIPGVANWGLIDAVDTTTGKIVWQKRFPQKVVAGLMVVGDLVFVGESNGKFNALDAKSGDILWTYEPAHKGVGGANGSAAAYEIDGRVYVVMAFGGNNQARSSQKSPPGDALIAFAVPNGKTELKEVSAEPKQVETGAIPKSAMKEPLKKAPEDAQVLRLETHDFRFFPDRLTAKPGQKLAIHLVNTGVPPAGFAIKLPDGPLALKGPVKPKQEAYFVFKAPEKPGEYKFFSPLGPQKAFGMMGTLVIGNTDKR